MFRYWRDNPLVGSEYLQTLPLVPTFSVDASIVLVVPHPDDETLGCAGLIQSITAAALPFRIIMVTDGNKHGKKIRRKKEVLQAMSACGVVSEQFEFLDFPDGTLRHQATLPDLLMRSIAAFAPTHIIVTDPEDTHADHAVLGSIVSRSAPKINTVQCIWSIMIHYHRFPRPLGRLPLAPLLPPGRLTGKGFTWLNYPLSLQQQLVKRTALSAFKSQLLTPFLRGLMFSFDRPNEIYREILKRP